MRRSGSSPGPLNAARRSRPDVAVARGPLLAEHRELCVNERPHRLVAAPPKRGPLFGPARRPGACRYVDLVAVDIRPATADRWTDLVVAFGRRGEDPSWCWCQRFVRSAHSASPTGEEAGENRDALCEEIAHASVPPGLIAYVDGTPVGWTRVGPRDGFPGVRGNRALAKVLTEDDPGTWWITCFVVDSRHRRSGVGSALLQAAVEFARRHGGTAVEGHPVDVAALAAARVGGSALFTGTRAMFVESGFVEVARTHPARPVMRLEL